MASNIVLTPYGTDGAASGSALTLYGGESAAISAGSNVVFLGIASHRASPWDVLAYPGANAIRGKFMGARPRTYSIFGYITPGTASPETTVRDAMASVMALNKSQVYYTVTAGALLIHDSTGLICEEVVASMVGGQNGILWHFEIRMRDLGTT